MLSSLIRPLLILWGAVTAAFLAVVAWKSLVGARETDVVIADPLEDRQAEQQKMVISQVQTLLMWAKGLGIASLALLLIVGGISIYVSLSS
jgi:hypothetical protein